jgi:NAD-dependent oxidoreductase involved in siderophore biosynthesis
MENDAVRARLRYLQTHVPIVSRVESVSNDCVAGLVAVRVSIIGKCRSIILRALVESGDKRIIKSVLCPTEAKPPRAPPQLLQDASRLVQYFVSYS